MSTVSDPYPIECSYDEATPASIAIIRALCAIENVDPTNAPENLDVTLFDHVDPEALDTIVADGAGNGDVLVDLTLDTYRVSIADTGRIRVRPKR